MLADQLFSCGSYDIAADRRASAAA